MATLFFEDVRIPKQNLLGAEGGGLVHMMRNLEVLQSVEPAPHSRPQIERLTLAAMSVGIAERSFEIMLEYADTRKVPPPHACRHLARPPHRHLARASTTLAKSSATLRTDTP